MASRPVSGIAIAVEHRQLECIRLWIRIALEWQVQVKAGWYASLLTPCERRIRMKRTSNLSQPHLHRSGFAQSRASTNLRVSFRTSCRTVAIPAREDCSVRLNAEDDTERHALFNSLKAATAIKLKSACFDGVKPVYNMPRFKPDFISLSVTSCRP